MPDSAPFSASLDAKVGIDIPELRFSSTLLVFQLSDRFAAFRLEDVERITPMAELASPPGLPSVLEGVLNLAGVAIPVLRLDRLFGLPTTQHLGLHSMLIILRVPREGGIAILVDRATEILSVFDSAFLPIDQEDSFNGCAAATVTVRDDIIPVLSPTYMLLAKEKAVLTEFQTMAQKRLQDWGISQA